MKHIDYRAVLQRFCRENKVMYDLSAPFLCGDWSVATDGKIACYVPKSLYEAEMRENVPHAERLLISAPINGTPTTIKQWAMKAAAKCPETKDCGCFAGRCRCRDCDVYHECGTCNGTGKVKDTLKVVLGESIFQYKYLVMIRDVAQALGSQTITVFQGEPLRQWKFMIGDVVILLIPMKDAAIIDTVDEIKI